MTADMGLENQQVASDELPDDVFTNAQYAINRLVVGLTFRLRVCSLRQRTVAPKT